MEVVQTLIKTILRITSKNSAILILKRHLEEMSVQTCQSDGNA